jgi:hypothetical protein
MGRNVKFIIIIIYLLSCRMNDLLSSIYLGFLKLPALFLSLIEKIIDKIQKKSMKSVLFIAKPGSGSALISVRT